MQNKRFQFRRRSDSCLNCGHPLLQNHNFCPSCGQKNNHSIVSFDELIKEVFGTIVNFDTRWTRTIKPLFVKPGELTNAFLEGRRLEYTDPVKLYFFASLVFFLTLSNVIVNPVGNILNEKRFEIEKRELSFKDFGFIDTDENDSLKKEISDSLKLAQNLLMDSIKVLTVKEIEKNKKKKGSKKENPNHKQADSLAKKDTNNRLTFLRFVHLVEDRTLTPKQLLDSFRITGLDFKDFEGSSTFVAEKLQKIGRNDFVLFIGKYVDWLSLMVISLLPLFAAFLSLLNFRLKRLFIEHLIFTIHVQAFSYIFLALSLLLFGLTQSWYVLFLSVITCFYAIVMFKNVYKQSWLKSILKIMFLGSFYFSTLLIALTIHFVFIFLIY